MTEINNNEIMEINKITAQAKETKILLTGVPLLDGSGANEVPFDVLTRIINAVTKKVPDTTIFLIVAGSTKCQALIYTPNDDINVREWILACGMGEVGKEEDSWYTFAEMECEYPLKMKDQINSLAFAYLRKNKLLDEEESEDELFDF